MKLFQSFRSYEAKSDKHKQELGLERLENIYIIVNTLNQIE